MTIVICGQVVSALRPGLVRKLDGICSRGDWGFITGGDGIPQQVCQCSDVAPFGADLLVSSDLYFVSSE